MNFRSKYEARVYEKNRKLAMQYEPVTFTYPHPVHRGKCLACGSTTQVTRPSMYTPDFRLANTTFVEAKGKFTPANRTRLLAFRAHHPNETVRLLFMRDNWLTKKHARRYSDWCKDNGFEYAIGETIPKEWAR